MIFELPLTHPTNIYALASKVLIAHSDELDCGMACMYRCNCDCLIYALSDIFQSSMDFATLDSSERRYWFGLGFAKTK